MVSKIISDSIINAKEALDTVETNGEIAYDICDGILTNIKAFIHDAEVWTQINEHEQKVYSEFKRRIDLATLELKDKSPITSWKEGVKQYMSLRRWKSLEMLKLYDKLGKEYDI